MSEVLTLKKSNPLEIIEVGDIVQINPSDGLIQKAFWEPLFNSHINTRLVVGICVTSDNTTPLNLIITGGTSKSKDGLLINGGLSDSIQTYVIIGGDSSLNPRQIIQIAYNGEQVVNMADVYKENDLVCISKEPGKGKSIKCRDFRFVDKIDIRKIGKITEILADTKQAKVMLNIE